MNKINFEEIELALENASDEEVNRLLELVTYKKGAKRTFDFIVSEYNSTIEEWISDSIEKGAVDIYSISAVEEHLQQVVDEAISEHVCNG